MYTGNYILVIFYIFHNLYFYLLQFLRRGLGQVPALLGQPRVPGPGRVGGRPGGGGGRGSGRGCRVLAPAAVPAVPVVREQGLRHLRAGLHLHRRRGEGRAAEAAGEKRTWARGVWP